MKLRSPVFAVFFILFAMISCLVQAQDFTMTPIGANEFLNKPWDLHYGPDDHLWVTERPAGIVVRVNPATAERDDLIQIPDIFSSFGQDGLLGMALHEDLLGDHPYVYLAYTQTVQGENKQRIVRYTYSIDGEDGSLSSPMVILDNLPLSNDHNSGRLIFGPDEKLYYTIGDQGSNQGGNFCKTILSQVLPSQAEIDVEDWSNYPGKILRINTDGSIPNDNPMLNGVQSHVYSYGHRNAQGIVFGNNGLLYSDEHGPVTDDEVNVIFPGGNYGWPNVAGYQDDQAYDYCNWSTATDCESEEYIEGLCPNSAELMEESAFMASNYQEPLLSMFAVADDYDFENPACENAWVCRPNVAPSSIAFYGNDAIPGWKNSVLVSSLKRGKVYRLKLDESGTSVVGDTTELFYTPNRYRDIVVDPDGISFYVITDASGRTSGPDGLTQVSDLQNRGNILKFTYQGPVSVSSVVDEKLFKIWPNPTTDNIHIEINGSHEFDLRAELINTSGQVMKRIAGLQPGMNTMAINDFSSGVYVLKVYSKTRSWQQKVIVQQ